MLDDEIVPLLLGARPPRHSVAAVRMAVPFEPQPAEVASFADLCCQPRETQARRHIDQLLAEGVSLEQIFLKLITPAARHLGAHWERDTMDFALVTLGLMNLHTVAHELAYGDEDNAEDASETRRILLACAPDSQHFLGLTIVSQFFRRDGWRVVVEVTPTVVALERALSEAWFDAVGLSVGLVEQVPGLKGVIGRLRQASRNPHLSVMLGGPAFLKVRTSARELGADGISVDARHGVQLTAQLVEQQRKVQARQPG